MREPEIPPLEYAPPPVWRHRAITRKVARLTCIAACIAILGWLALLMYPNIAGMYWQRRAFAAAHTDARQVERDYLRFLEHFGNGLSILANFTPELGDELVYRGRHATPDGHVRYIAVELQSSRRSDRQGYVMRVFETCTPFRGPSQTYVGLHSTADMPPPVTVSAAPSDPSHVILSSESGARVIDIWLRDELDPLIEARPPHLTPPPPASAAASRPAG